MISGPMPSPGRTATFISEIPGELGFAPRLEGADLVRVAQRQADLVEAVQQAVLAELVDLETELLRAVGGGDALRFQVDDQAESRKRRVVEEIVDLVLAQHHGQQAVLEAVDEEDVAVRRSNERPEAVIAQRPRRVRTRS